MKKRWIILIATVLMLSLTACGKGGQAESGTEGETESVPAWWEQYDLGMQHMESGEYSEAVVAFTAAISIEPKQASLYLTRGDVYMTVAESVESAVLSSAADTSTIVWSDINVQFGDDIYYTIPELYEKAINDYEEAVRLIESGEAVDEDDSILSEAAAKLEEAEEKKNSAGNSDEDTEISNQEENDLYNEYGSIEFTKRNYYQEFEEYSEEEQTFIEGLVEASETGNMDLVLELLDQYGVQTDGDQDYGSTIWNGYKIKMTTWSSETTMYDITYTNGTVAIEIHPENGTGYYLELTHQEEINAEHVFRDYVEYDYVVCPCTNWQWDGDYSETKQSEETLTPGDGTTSVRTTVVAVTGVMADGLRDGAFVVEVNSTSSDTPGTSSGSKYTEIYQSGELLSSGAEAVGAASYQYSMYFTRGTIGYFSEGSGTHGDFYW